MCRVRATYLNSNIFSKKRIFEDFVDIYVTSKIFILENFCTNIRINGTLAYCLENLSMKISI